MRLLVTLLAIPGLVAAQGAPGTNVAVDVEISTLSMRGDTVRVIYVVHNASSSAERIAQVTVDAPSPPVQIAAPSPPSSWFRSVQHGTRSVALWAPLDVHILPGQQTPPLAFEAVGLPAIVTIWVEGYFPPPTDIPSDTLPLGDPLIENSVADSTVGVDPLPANLSAGHLLSRLSGLLDQACGTLAWVSSGQTCTELAAKLDSAHQAVSQADTAGAQAHVNGFITEVQAQHGTGLPVNDSAYWLLKVNAEYILGKL